MKMCTRLVSRSAGVMAAGAVVVLMSATTAKAQQADPFRSVNFAAPLAAASDSLAVAADPQAPPAAPATPAEPGYVTFFKSTELGGLADFYYLVQLDEAELALPRLRRLAQLLHAQHGGDLG